MVIRQGRHVDANGVVYLPYLAEWKNNKSDLLRLADSLCTGKNDFSIIWKECFLNAEKDRKLWILCYFYIIF